MKLPLQLEKQKAESNETRSSFHGAQRGGSTEEVLTGPLSCRHLTKRCGKTQVKSLG